jgi:hypothetical protein
MASVSADDADTGRFPGGLRRTTRPPRQSCWYSECRRPTFALPPARTTGLLLDDPRKVRQPFTADRPGVCVHAAAHPQPKGLAATTLRVLAGLGHMQLEDFFVQTFLQNSPLPQGRPTAFWGANQSSRFDGNVNGTSRWRACVECRKRPLLISHFICGGPAEDSKARYCCCRIHLLDDVCLVSRPPYVKTTYTYTYTMVHVYVPWYVYPNTICIIIMIYQVTSLLCIF